MAGAEALLRWSHPERGMVPPDQFIPLAEKTRLILPIGYWVLKTACQQCKTWQEKGFKPIRVAVNFSVYQLEYPELIDQIKEVLETYAGNCTIVRASRVLEGAVFDSDVFDSKKVTIPAYKFSAQKARILLMLALNCTKNHETIKSFFQEY